MNLKRISHRIKEEVGSTMEVANVVGIRGAFATFRGKVDIQIMVHNGHIEHPWIKKHLIKKHEATRRTLKMLSVCISKWPESVPKAVADRLR